MAGPKLVIAGGLAAVALLVTANLERGRDLAPAAPPPVKPAPPAASQPGPAPAKPVERTSAQGMAVDPHTLIVRRVLKIDGPFRHGDYKWDDAGVPAGPVVITVDLRAQTLSIFRAGYEIGAAVILYGATDKPSPLGAFPITEKDADHFSRTYNNAPMPFAQRLTSDGVYIHGSNVKWGNATHGCIGVPTPFAKKLFDATKVGDIVVITDGKMLDTSHAKAEG
ncbi:L,D-transpeptidase family protein [Sphingobium sp. AN558]|uniref:L,D-transpeptidase family protein n=1 Tax=Sphingobium sp. AN558 TaxID=3133442 RepID=UPI0030BEE1B4